MRPAPSVCGAVVIDATRIDLFVRWKADLLGITGTYVKSWQGEDRGWDESWTPFNDAFSLGSAPTAVSLYPGTWTLFAQGPDRALWSNWHLDGNWQGWKRHGGVLASAPAAAALGSSGLFATWFRNAESGLTGFIDDWRHAQVLDFEAHGLWVDSALMARSAPAVVCKSSRGMDLFAVGPDHALWTKFFGRDEDPYADSIEAGSDFKSDLASPYDSPGLSRWHGSGWGSLGGYCTSAPAAVSVSTDAIDVFVRGSDNALWTKYWRESTGWSVWGSLGGVLTSAPTVLAHGPTVFVRNTAGGISTKFYSRTFGWSDWGNLGGETYLDRLDDDHLNEKPDLPPAGTWKAPK